MIEKKSIKATAVIIDAKDFPKDCRVCPFQSKSRCIPQGELSTISTKERPGLCPLITEYAYKMRMEKMA